MEIGNEDHKSTKFRRKKYEDEILHIRVNLKS